MIFQIYLNTRLWGGGRKDNFEIILKLTILINKQNHE